MDITDPIDVHSARIQALLDAPNINAVSQRLLRTHYRVQGEYVVASIVQRFAPDGSVSLSIYVTRAFQTAQMTLSGKYSIREIVAFLRLDLVDPDALSWRDETTYVLVASGVNGILEGLK